MLNLGRDLAAMPFAQLGFVVVQIDVRRGAVLEQINNALRLGREMRHTEQTAEAWFLARFAGRGTDQIAIQQRSDCSRADTSSRATKEMAASEFSGVLLQGCMI